MSEFHVRVFVPPAAFGCRETLRPCLEKDEMEDKVIIKADVQVLLNSKLCKRHFSERFQEISCLDFFAGLSELPVKHTHSLDVDARSCWGALVARLEGCGSTW